MIGKNSGGVLNVTSADGTGSTNLVLPESGTVIAADASGNVGIGTTPSAWNVAFKGLEFGGGTLLSQGSSGIFNTQNAYFDTTWKYKNTGYASYISQQNGQHQWYTAPSGTTGNAITWTNAMTLDTSGNLGIGVTPSAKLEVSTSSLTGCVIRTSAYDATSTTGEIKLGLGFNNHQAAGISCQKAGSANQADLVFYTEYGFNIAKEVMRLKAYGDLLLTAGTGALGYGTGAGGTVTQVTSKTTSVTLNKPTGQITMNNAALAAGVTVGFIFNNTLLSINDTLNLSMSSGTVGSYNIWCQPANGLAVIQVKNISAGSLSEAVVINFDVIKGATA